MGMRAARCRHKNSRQAKHVESMVFPRLDESSILSWSTFSGSDSGLVL